MKRLIVFIFVLTAVFSLSAQPKAGKFDIENYKAEQHKFIQKAVKFTQEEATAFFQLYDELRTKEFQLFTKGRKDKRVKNMSEEQCRMMILDHDNTELQIKKLQMQYHKKMLRVIPASKLMWAIHAGEEFDRMKIREAFSNGGKRPAPGKRPVGGPGSRSGRGPCANTNVCE